MNTTEPTEQIQTPDPALDDLQSENERLRSELRLRSARDTLLSAFTSEQARSPELLFDASVSRFEFDGDGSLTNTEALIAGLRQKFPEQFVTEEAALAAGAVGIPVPSIHAGVGREHPVQTLTREALAQMTPQEVALLDWNDVKQVLQHP
jgi:hypothetical protein